MTTIGKMKAVGIKELKARLSEFVRLVTSGETVLVTERDEVVAELRPPRHPRLRDTQEDVLEDLAASGDVTRSTLPKKGLDLESPRPRAPRRHCKKHPRRNPSRPGIENRNGRRPLPRYVRGSPRHPRGGHDARVGSSHRILFNPDDIAPLPGRVGAGAGSGATTPSSI